MIKVNTIKTCCDLGYMTGPEEKGITVRRLILGKSYL